MRTSRFTEQQVVAATATCHNNDTLVTWNTQGIQYPAGPAGPTAPDDPTGPTGAPGVQGVAGPQGTPGLSGVQTVSNSARDYPSFTLLTVACPAGTQVIAGGAWETDGNATLLSSFPVGTAGRQVHAKSKVATSHSASMRSAPSCRNSARTERCMARRQSTSPCRPRVEADVEEDFEKALDERLERLLDFRAIVTT